MLSRRSKPGRDGIATSSKSPVFSCRIGSSKNKSNKRSQLQIRHLRRQWRILPLAKERIWNHHHSRPKNKLCVQLHLCPVLVWTYRNPRIDLLFTKLLQIEPRREAIIRSRREKEQIVKEPNNIWAVRLNRPFIRLPQLATQAIFQPTTLFFQQDQIIVFSKTRKSSRKLISTSR